MSEFSLVEQPVIEWLTGKPNLAPPDPGLGWTYRDAASMATYERPLEDPLVEALLLEALLRINPEIKTPDEAKRALAPLRLAMQNPDNLTANRDTLALLQKGATVVLRDGEPAHTVHYIDYNPAKQSLNDFTATNQYRVQGLRDVRQDTVLLVNGIPLVIAEYKSYGTSRKDWREAVRQLHRYQREAPLLLTPNLFCIGADEQEFRYGTVLFHDATRDDIEQHLDHWGKWLSLYPETKGYWNELDAHPPDDPLKAPIRGLLRLAPCHLLDFLRHFVVFETKKGKTIKKIARYQQFEAVNDIVDRAVGIIGKDVEAGQRTGLVWHTQGSGKSLTMIYAGEKLRSHPALCNPTVLIVVDRRDLKTQLSDDFESCDYPNVEKAMGVTDLKNRLRQGWRGTLVTTVQSFQRMSDLTPLDRDNVICLIDECHRTQKGNGQEGFAMTMRVKLPKAFRFGFTGTPIDRTMNNTHRDFGPIRDGVQERYLSYYGYKRAILDGATLPVHYLRARVPFVVNEEALNLGYEAICEEMELEDEEAKEFVQRKNSGWRLLARLPERISIITEKLLDHFLAHPDPSGFKAQLVCVDREACALYKDALDLALAARGLPPEWCDVIISADQNGETHLNRFYYSKAEQDNLISRFKQTPQQWEKENRDLHGDNRTQWTPPVKILIVCDRLLTGFDAPIEAVMYLDKPLRDHNLLQAIARTNRPLPALGKKVGLIVDYFGVFDNLEKALNFDEAICEEALIDWEKLKETVPDEVKRCLEPFDGIPQSDTRDTLLATLRVLADPEIARAWEGNFKSLERLWEAIAPDACLYEFRHSYAWLCGVYLAHRRRNGSDKGTNGELSVKTRRLIQEFTTFTDLAAALPVYRIDANTLTALEELPTAADKAAALEAALTQELAEDGGGFAYRKLGERLAEKKKRQDAGDEATEARLLELEQMTGEVTEIKEAPQRLYLTGKGEFELFTALRVFAPAAEETYVADCARRMVAHLQTAQLLTPGWSQSRGARMRVEQSLLVESWNPAYATLGFNPDDADPPFLKPAVEELAKTDG